MQNIPTFDFDHGRTNQQPASTGFGWFLLLLALLLLGLSPGRARAATGFFESYVKVGPTSYVLSRGVNLGANLGGGNGDRFVDNDGNATNYTTAFTVAAPPTAMITSSVNNCAGSPATVTFSFVGAAPFTVSYSDGISTFTLSNQPATVVLTPTLFADAAFTITALSDATGNADVLPPTYNVPVNTVANWTGVKNTDWFDPANWNNGCVPNQYIDAIIGNTAPRYPIHDSGPEVASVKTLILEEAPGKLTYTSGGLDLWGDLRLGLNRDGLRLARATYFTFGSFFLFTSATGGSKLRILGNVSHAILSLNDVWEMEVDTNPTNVATTATTTLRNSLVVWRSLTMRSGILSSGGTDNTIGLLNPANPQGSGTATLAETETGYVLGKVGARRPLTAGTADDAQGLGLRLTPATGSVSPGSTDITRITGTAPTNVGSGPGILRYFQLQPTVSTGLNMQLDFAYFNHELNGLAPADLRLFRAANSVAGPWADQSPTTAAPNVVTKTGIANLSGFWTLGRLAAPLPVSLTAFEATRQGADALLSWRTASETDNAGFEVQTSAEGTSFRKLGFVAAASANSSTPRSYSFRDTEPGKTGLRYYRLRQMDLDGKATFSPVRSVSFEGSGASGGLSLDAAPNPFGTGGLRLLVQLPQPETATRLTLTDALGRRVFSQALSLPAGGSQVELPGTSQLAPGVYLLEVSLNGQVQHRRVLKE